jgi:hypothetical protein
VAHGPRDTETLDAAPPAPDATRADAGTGGRQAEDEVYAAMKADLARRLEEHAGGSAASLYARFAACLADHARGKLTTAGVVEQAKRLLLVEAPRPRRGATRAALPSRPTLLCFSQGLSMGGRQPVAVPSSIACAHNHCSSSRR